MAVRVEINGEEREHVNEWIRFGMKVAAQGILHPLEYSKVLIQIGFEPIDPVPCKTLFGKHALGLPNVFSYVGHIKSVDGFAGCYRGLGPKLVGNILATHFSEKIADLVGCEKIDETEKEYKDLVEEEEESYKRFEAKLKRDIVTHTAGAIISSPFHVISIRMMAQFVGRETKYSSLFGSIIQIYKDEGILGFFSGLIPRIIFDLSCVVVASTATYIVGRHLIREKDAKMYFGTLTSFVCSSMFYPMNVVSTCMIVNRSGLRAGTLPFMPRYDSWQHCYNSLKLTGDHKRGSSLFFRYLKIGKTPVMASRIN